MSISKADYDELVRLRDLCVSMRLDDYVDLTEQEAEDEIVRRRES